MSPTEPIDPQEGLQPDHLVGGQTSDEVFEYNATAEIYRRGRASSEDSEA